MRMTMTFFMALECRSHMAGVQSVADRRRGRLARPVPAVAG